ncbi:caspase, EACC1-associated type [Candidatus Electronema sp. PJ]|uniref:caspase, EACC1-associated type n=1 Tax=Candidatus Electronema sp. PJ TaxID=3401572 RepID=UPI003AA9780F
MTEKRYAILIASSKYPDEPGLTELRCPENDVDAVDEILRSQEFGQFTTFVFKNVPNREIEEKIESVLADAGKNDLVLIYFSGHGKLNSSSGQLCLATTNTRLKTLQSTSVSVERIKSFFDSSATRKKILILDCCYSGAAGSVFAKGGVDDQLQIMSRGQGTFIMTASTGIQVAVEKESEQFSLFTKHLVEGIKSGEADKNDDGFVDMHELYEYVNEKVREDGAQEPMKLDLHAKGEMIIAYSGKESREKRRKEIRRKLYDFAAQGLLTDDIVNEAARSISLPKQGMSGKDQEFCILIDRLVADKINPADFIMQWMNIRFTLDGLADGSSNRFAEKEKKAAVHGNFVDRKEDAKEESLEVHAVAPAQAIGENRNNHYETKNFKRDFFIIALLGAGSLIYYLATRSVSGSNNTPKEQPNSGKISPAVQEIFDNKVPQQDKMMTDTVTGMELVYIPKGCFMMGSPENEEGRGTDEGPIPNVCVDGLWMGKYEVTQGQWKKIMNSANPASFKQGDDYPVENISWEDTQKFIVNLNTRTGRNYSLPTEAEWEYACRAGGSGKYCGGSNLDDVAWYKKNSGDSTHPVGGKQKNGFGLHDMSGNVWEWCIDRYGAYNSNLQNNPTGSPSVPNYVIRGGGWGDPDSNLRAARRIKHNYSYAGWALGFRLVLPSQQGK